MSGYRAFDGDPAERQRVRSHLRQNDRETPPLLWVVGLLLLAGCATGKPRLGLTSGFGPHTRQGWREAAVAHIAQESGAARAEMGSAGGFPEQGEDAFQVVQEASGLGEEERHPPGAALYPAQARALLGLLERTLTTGLNVGPRRALRWLLEDVARARARVEYEELRWRAERFEWLVMVRPDGYLVTALRGTPLQRRGPLRLEAGAWKAGHLTVGGFYFSLGGVFYPVTQALRRQPVPPVGELGLGRDWVNAALDGAQEAVGEMVVALGGCVVHPIRTLEGLAQLPQAVATLIAASPEYFARYGAMSREDQIREAARLSTHVLMLVAAGEAVVAGSLWRCWGASRY